MFPSPSFSRIVVASASERAGNKLVTKEVHATELNQTFFAFLEEDEKYNHQINTLFRTVHIGTFNTSVQVC